MGREFRLVNYHHVPPGGWYWLCPEDGTKVIGGSIQDLMVQVEKHCAAASLDPAPTQAEVEEQICSRAGGGWCADQDGNPGPNYVKKVLDISQVIQFTKAMLSWFKGGMKHVEQAEAERRAQICVKCPLNQELTGCSSCAMKPLKAAIGLFKGGKSTSLDNGLKFCRACGCTLEVKIWFERDLLRENMAESQLEALAENCWLR